MKFRGKSNPMPPYNQSKEELEWYAYCMNNGIRISPGGLKDDSSHWTIDVSTDGTTWHRSPKKYNSEEIWVNYYRIAEYYYEKRNKNS